MHTVSKIISFDNNNYNIFSIVQYWKKLSFNEHLIIENKN